jgi:mannosyltransferase
VVPTSALLLIAIASPDTYQPRYLSMCAPFVALAIGFGVARITSRIGVALVLATLIALATPAAITERSVEAKKDPTWSQVAALVSHLRVSDRGTAAIIYGPIQPHHAATARVIAYAYPVAFAATIDVTLRTPAAQTGGLWETQTPLVQSLDRLDEATVVYVLTTEGPKRQAFRSAELRAAGWVRADGWKLGTVSVIKYER